MAAWTDLLRTVILKTSPEPIHSRRTIKVWVENTKTLRYMSNSLHLVYKGSV